MFAFGGQYFVAILAGSLTTLSPCVLPILPLIVGAGVVRNRLTPLFISLGLVGSFTLVGWSVATFGSLLGFSSENLRLIGAALLGVFGAVFVSERLSDFFSKTIEPLVRHSQQKLSLLAGESWLSSVLIGVFLGIVWAPCSGPTLGTAVALAIQDGGGLKSFLIMLFFGVGAVLPLLLVAYGAGKLIKAKQSRLLTVSSKIKKLFGAVMIIIFILIISGLDKWIEAHIVSILPDAWVDLTTRF